MALPPLPSRPGPLLSCALHSPRSFPRGRPYL